MISFLRSQCENNIKSEANLMKLFCDVALVKLDSRNERFLIVVVIEMYRTSYQGQEYHWMYQNQLGNITLWGILLSLVNHTCYLSQAPQAVRCLWRKICHVEKLSKWHIVSWRNVSTWEIWRDSMTLRKK